MNSNELDYSLEFLSTFFVSGEDFIRKQSFNHSAIMGDCKPSDVMHNENIDEALRVLHQLEISKDKRSKTGDKGSINKNWPYQNP